MGRPPCCDKVGVKKGPWTPEEDIMLVSYVQENGPGNWRAVPTTTGLRRCSKSCRLRWTNYLRPGIKRGSFTDQEEKMIIQLQALLGNKWAAIASYFPERTDNDIKNYWNTHLKKKLNKLEAGSGTDHGSISDGISTYSHSISRGQWERRLQTDIHTAKQALHDAISFEKTNEHLPDQLMDPGHSKPGPGHSFSYASSTENIARLLKQWVKDPTKSVGSTSKCSSTQNSCNNMDSVCSEETDPEPKSESKNGSDMSEAFESMFGFESFGSSTSDDFGESKPGNPNGLGSLSVLENWLDNWMIDDQLMF